MDASIANVPADVAAEAEAAVGSAGRWLDGFMGGDWPGQADVLTLAGSMHAGVAALLIVLGVVYLLFGYTAFKWFVILNAIAAGIWLGVVVGGTFEQPIPGAVVGGLAAGAATWPALRWAVCLLGGVLGFVIGVAVWNGTGHEPTYALAGGLIGAVFLGMLSLVLYRTSLVLFMSVQGAVMLVLGILGMTLQHEGAASATVKALTDQPLILPIALLVPLVVGLMYQGGWAKGEAGGKGA
jgi:hypothetical protein